MISIFKSHCLLNRQSRCCTGKIPEAERGEAGAGVNCSLGMWQAVEMDRLSHVDGPFKLLHYGKSGKRYQNEFQKISPILLLWCKTTFSCKSLEFPQKAALTVRRNEFDGICQLRLMHLFVCLWKICLFRQGHSFDGQNEGAS